MCLVGRGGVGGRGGGGVRIATMDLLVYIYVYYESSYVNVLHMSMHLGVFLLLAVIAYIHFRNTVTKHSCIYMMGCIFNCWAPLQMLKLGTSA